MSRRTSGPGTGDLLTRAEHETIGKRILSLCSGSKARVSLSTSVGASTWFARGDVHLAGEWPNCQISLWLELPNGQRAAIGGGGALDDARLERLVRQAEAAARQQQAPTPSWWDFPGPQQYPTPPKLFYESVVDAMTAQQRAVVIETALDATESAGLVGAGDINFRRHSVSLMNTEGLFSYVEGTSGELSLTARTPDGRGSGWSWGGNEDWARVDVESVIGRAIDLAQRSANPVAVEPGRYTVILEPAAASALIGGLSDLEAIYANLGITVYAKDPQGTNKLGLQMIDRRLGLVSDPWDPDLPDNTVSLRDGSPLGKVVWLERGVLKNLVYSRDYRPPPGQYVLHDRMKKRLTFEGQTQTLEEMIASTKRGIWINRLWGGGLMSRRTGLSTGTTRDGTFLIENGRITKPIKNLRYTESPLFVLNKLEAVGEPVRADAVTVVPRLKVRDFNFTSLTDAI